MVKKKTLTREYFRRQGKRGVKARMDRTTPEQRREIARRAAAARWKKKE